MLILKYQNLVLHNIETEEKIKKYVDESHITSSTNFKRLIQVFNGGC